MAHGAVSITSTESFAARAQRIELTRVGIWASAVLSCLVVLLVRRWMGGVVMSTDAVFWPMLGVLVVLAVGQVPLAVTLRRATREGRLLRPWVWQGAAVVDLCFVAGMMTVGSIFSPRGAMAALSAPPILLLALVVMLSVLRLRARFTLLLGLAAAAFHAALATRALYVSPAPMEEWPVAFTYAALLAIFAEAAALVAREVRNHVMAAAEEAAAHERAEARAAGMQRDLRIARDIQRGLLPSGAPVVAGFEIAGVSEPADLTGGDYYDWQVLPDGRLLVVLADVSGHGVGPALVMAVCRAYARASASTIAEAGPLLARVNELISADLQDDQFITLALAIVGEDGRVEVLSAGHGPTFFYKASTAHVTQYGGDGLPLGVHAGEAYGPGVTLRMEEGDVLVFCTDGYHEWRRAGETGEAYGTERLARSLMDAAGGKPGEILERLDRDVRGFVEGAVQQDDMTAVVIKRVARVEVEVGGEVGQAAGAI